jgi:hypothetical protein
VKTNSEKIGYQKRKRKSEAGNDGLMESMEDRTMKQSGPPRYFDHAWCHHERDTQRWRTDSSCRPVQDLSTVTSPKIQDLSTAKLASKQKSKI